MLFGDLVDKPIAYFFAGIEEKLKLKEKLVSFFLFIVVPRENKYFFEHGACNCFTFSSIFAWEITTRNL